MSLLVRAASDSREFRKRVDCPSSDTLLTYAGQSLLGTVRERVKLHLAHCDFCRAELYLLEKHTPPAEVAYAHAPLPLALLLFAGQSLPKRGMLKKALRGRAA